MERGHRLRNGSSSPVPGSVEWAGEIVFVPSEQTTRSRFVELGERFHILTYVVVCRGYDVVCKGKKKNFSTFNKSCVNGLTQSWRLQVFLEESTHYSEAISRIPCKRFLERSIQIQVQPNKLHCIAIRSDGT